MQDMLKIVRSHGSRAGVARGITIVIDVIRAFSVAAYAFAGGAAAICLVRTVEEAIALRDALTAEGLRGRTLAQPPLLAGEVGGRLISGFDLNNSPTRMTETDVRGRVIIQRTGAGTQGAMNASGASQLLMCSLVNAHATAAYARHLAEETGDPITLLPTATLEQVGSALVTPMEDEICADYLTALLREAPNAQEELDAALARMAASGRLNDFAEGDADMPASDIPLALATDRFKFAMPGERATAGSVAYVYVTHMDVPPSWPV